MKLFYRAVNPQGKIVKGLVDAKDQADAASFLRKQELTPIRITTQAGPSILAMLKRKNANTDLVFFTRQLSSMLSSGLTLMQALTILRNQIQNPAMAEVVAGIIANIEEGKTFSFSVAKYPKVFSSIYASLIKAAESAGLLDKILLRLADNLEKEQKLHGMIKSAMMYPIVVLIMMVAVLAVMMIFVIPQLTGLYTNMNIELPFATRVVIGLSDFMLKFWPLLLGVGIGGFIFFNRWKKTSAGKRIIDGSLLKLPIFGKLISQSIMVEFSRTFGLLAGTGSLIVESLNESAEVVGNVHYRIAILEVGKKVEKGVTIGDAMLSDVLFPPIIVEMVKIGEQTGKLDEALIRVSEYYEREVEQTIKALTTAMEPLILIVLAVGVGFLVISIITPIYNLISQIQ